MADGGVPLDADGDGEVDGAREADLRQGQQDGHQVGVPVDTADPGNQCSAVDTEMWSVESPGELQKTLAKLCNHNHPSLCVCVGNSISCLLTVIRDDTSFVLCLLIDS